MAGRNLFLVTLTLLSSFSFAQNLQPHVKFPQEEINKVLKEAVENPLKNFSVSKDSRVSGQGRSAFSILKRMEELKNPVRRNSGSQNSVQQIDTVFVGDVPNDTLVITGNYTHTGPIFVFNDGVLIFHNANVTNVGDVFVFGSGRMLADSSSLFFPQQYFYERSLVAVQNSYVHLETCSLSYGGFSHTLFAGDSATVEMNNTFFNDWTTAGVSGHPTVSIHGANLGGEYILADHATLSFDHVNTLILWHHFPDSAVINYSFPPGDTLNNYAFDNAVPGVSGIGYQVNADSCTNVMWGLMPVNGSDVTVSNSSIRAIGAWFQHGDSVSVSGLVDNSNYSNFIAPLADRNLHLINSNVQTWSLYVFDSSFVNITSCILGEVGTQGSSRVISSQFFLDGSGGYFWATDTSFTVASSVSVTSNVRSERNGVFVFAYGSLTSGTASATGHSVMIVIQSGLPQDPIAYDNGVAWLANIGQPSSALVNAMVPVTGSAWIDQGPLGSFMDFGSYSLYYQQQGAFGWNALVTDSMTEIRNNFLALWNTNGLSPGNYLFRLVLKNNLGDSVDAIKNVTLLPSILSVDENDPDHALLKIFPNPVSDHSAVELILNKSSFIRIQICNVFGQEVETIADGKLTAGVYRFNFDAARYPDGIYFYKLLTEENNLEGKFIVQKK